VKVLSPISSNQVVRGLVAVSLVWALAAGGAVAPIVASAEESQPAVVAPASADASATASAETSAAAVAPSTIATPPLVPAPVAKKLTVRQIIAKVGSAAGLSKAEVAALLWIAKHESNYHPRSRSASGCYGLFQLSQSMAHGHPWQDPAWNTKRAIKYMKGRYGGVLRAKAFWSAHHWY
jgi:soluble lytic murein transglycosylase-like protein